MSEHNVSGVKLPALETWALLGVSGQLPSRSHTSVKKQPMVPIMYEAEQALEPS
jgi:hypothetical protein